MDDGGNTGVYTKILRQLHNSGGAPPEPATAVVVVNALHRKLLEGGRDFNHMEVYVRDPLGRDQVSKLLGDVEYLSAEVERLVPFVPKTWTDFEELAAAKFGRTWRREVGRKLGIEPSRLKSFQALNSVPLAHFTSLLSYEETVDDAPAPAARPAKLTEEARAVVRALWDNGVPAAEIAALMGDLVRGAVTGRQVEGVIAGTLGPDPADPGPPGNGDQPLRPGELVRMARELAPGVDPATAWRRFCAFAETQCGVVPRDLAAARKGRPVRLPDARLREAHALSQRCLASPRFAAFAERYADVAKPRKKSKTAKAAPRLGRIVIGWFGEDAAVDCFSVFSGLSPSHIAMVLRGNRKPSQDLVRFVEEVDARRRVDQERDRLAAAPKRAAAA